MVEEALASLEGVIEEVLGVPATEPEASVLIRETEALHLP